MEEVRGMMVPAVINLQQLSVAMLFFYIIPQAYSSASTMSLEHFY